jgi:integrase
MPGRKRDKGIKGRGSVFPRKDGRWVAQFVVEETGKMKQLYAKTEKEALEKLDKALLEQKQGILATGPKRKLGDHLKWWLEEVKRPKLQETSYIRYQTALKHILPKLGNIPLQKLTTEMIQTFYNSKIKEGQSASSVHAMHKIVHGALTYAVKTRLLPYNPSDNVSLPTRVKRKVKPMTLEQAQHLLHAAQGHHLEMLITLALTTGMRHGELIALRWEDIDFEQGSIYVHRTEIYQGKAGFYEKEPKTEAGERTIFISKTLCEKLKQHRIHQNEQRSKAGSKWKNLDLVCCNRKGGFFLFVGVRASFYRLLDKAGLPRMHIHDLRHHAATLMRSLGVDLKVVQEILGHADLDVTANIYSYTLPHMQKDAAKKMDILLQ